MQPCAHAARPLLLGLCCLVMARGEDYYPRLINNPDFCPDGDWQYSPDTGKCYGLVDGKIDAAATAAAAETRYYSLTWKQCEAECEKLASTLVSYQTRKEWKMLRRIREEWNDAPRRRLESPLMPPSPFPMVPPTTAPTTITQLPTLVRATVSIKEPTTSLRQLFGYTGEPDREDEEEDEPQKTPSPTIDVGPTPATVTRGNAPTPMQAFIGAYQDKKCIWRWTSGGKLYEDEFAWSKFRHDESSGEMVKECATMAKNNNKAYWELSEASCTVPSQHSCFCEYTSTSADANARLSKRPPRDPKKDGRPTSSEKADAVCACDYSKWVGITTGCVLSFLILMPCTYGTFEGMFDALMALPRQSMVAGKVSLLPSVRIANKKFYLSTVAVSGVSIGTGLVLHALHAKSHCRYRNGREDLLKIGWLLILIGASWQGYVFLWYRRLKFLHRMAIRQHGVLHGANHEDSLDASASLVRLDPNAPWKWRVKLQAELTPDDLVRMVRPEAISAELVKELELASTPGGITCIICNGTGVNKGTQAEMSALDAEKRNHLKVLRSLSSIHSDSDAEWGRNEEGSWFYVTELGWKPFDAFMNAVIEEANADGHGAKVDIRTQREHTEIDLTTQVMKVTNYSRDPPPVRFHKIKRVVSGTIELRCALFFSSFGRRLGVGAAFGGAATAVGAFFFTNVLPAEWNLLISILIGAATGCLIGAGICALYPCFFVVTTTIGTLGVEKTFEQQGLTAGRWYFEDGEGQWVAYDEAANEALEQAYTDLAEPEEAHPRTLRKDIRIAGPRATYVVNLERMVQRSRTYGGVTQRVRRVVVPIMPGQDTEETALDASMIDVSKRAMEEIDRQFQK